MRAITLAVAAIFALAGCGVPVQNAAQPIPAGVIPSPPLSPAPTPTPQETPTPAPPPEPVLVDTRVWFVREDGLVGVETAVTPPVTAAQVVEELSIGPTAEDIVDGLRTVSRDPLTGASLVSVVSEPQPDPNGRTLVTVSFGAAFAALPPTEQVLLLGQVVLSLTSMEIDAVAFVDDGGSPVAVPLPDGRLLDVPAVARDYASLIIEL